METGPPHRMSPRNKLKISFLPLVWVLLVVAILSPGCSKTIVATAPQLPTQTVSGELVSLSVPVYGNNGTLTINTPQGERAFTFSSNTTFAMENQACSLEDLGTLLSDGNTKYICTVVFATPCDTIGDLAFKVVR